MRRLILSITSIGVRISVGRPDGPGNSDGSRHGSKPERCPRRQNQPARGCYRNRVCALDQLGRRLYFQRPAGRSIHCLGLPLRASRRFKFRRFTLEVGETRTLNAHLARGLRQLERHRGADAAPDLNLTSAEVGGVITGSQTEDLPVNGRYWASLMALIPGAISSGTGTQDTIRFAGLSQEDNNFRFDGVDATGLNHAVRERAGAPPVSAGVHRRVQGEQRRLQRGRGRHGRRPGQHGLQERQQRFPRLRSMSTFGTASSTRGVRLAPASRRSS